MTSDAGFLRRLRDAIGPRDEFHSAPTIGDPLVRLCRHADDAAAHFVERARAAGMIVSLTTQSSLPTTIAALLSQWPATTGCALGAHTPEALDELRMLTSEWPAVDPTVGDALFAPGVVGVTDVLAALAETGSIVVASSRTIPRAVFLVPERHIVVVRASRVIPDLFDLFTDLGRPPAALTIVSGPSKTADIEGILITGVHGPREVHILFVTDS